MKKVVKRIFIIIAAIFAMVVLIVVASYINHQIQLGKEDELLQPMGQFVDVHVHQMHVYIEGDGDETLVAQAHLF